MWVQQNTDRNSCEHNKIQIVTVVFTWERDIIFQIINDKSSFWSPWCWDLNSQPLRLVSPPKTTRLGILPLLKWEVCLPTSHSPTKGLERPDDHLTYTQLRFLNWKASFTMRGNGGLVHTGQIQREGKGGWLEILIASGTNICAQFFRLLTFWIKSNLTFRCQVFVVHPLTLLEASNFQRWLINLSDIYCCVLGWVFRYRLYCLSLG